MGLSFQSAAQETAIPTFVVEKPTVIAFFAHMTDSELEKNPETNEALSDFQLYVSKAGPRLKAAGVDLQVANSDRFRIKTGPAIRIFKAGKINVGYYFVAPEKPPRIEYGVMTDDDILATAGQYFRLATQRP